MERRRRRRVGKVKQCHFAKNENTKLKLNDTTPFQLHLSSFPNVSLSTFQQPITTTHCSIPYQLNQQNLANHHLKLKSPPQLATPPTTTTIITTNTLPPCHTQQQPPKHINIKSTTTAITTQQ